MQSFLPSIFPRWTKAIMTATGLGCIKAPFRFIILGSQTIQDRPLFLTTAGSHILRLFL